MLSPEFQVAFNIQSGNLPVVSRAVNSSQDQDHLNRYPFIAGWTNQTLSSIMPTLQSARARQFIGPRNYQFIFVDPRFFSAVANTLYFGALAVPVHHDYVPGRAADVMGQASAASTVLLVGVLLITALQFSVSRRAEASY